MPVMKYQIMKGDRVRVIRGNDREAEGNVLEVSKTPDKFVLKA